MLFYCCNYDNCKSFRALLRVTVVMEKLDVQKFQEVIWYGAKNHEAGGNGSWRSWKYFTKGIYGPKVSTITLGSGVALFVKSLSAAGITTISSCDGHGKRSPYISFFGHYNACWFMVLYKNLLHNDYRKLKESYLKQILIVLES